MNDAERFWAKVNKDGPIPAHVPELGPCWVWTAALHRRGYGWFRFNGTPTLAHRVSWELTNGPIPDGLQVLHKCDNKPCERPDHFFLGTDADNMADKTAKGRGKTNGFENKMHCPKGHAYDAANTYIRLNKRHCRMCSRLKMRARTAAKRDQSRAIWGPVVAPAAAAR